MDEQEQARLDSLESDMRKIVSADWPPPRPVVETVAEREPVTLPEWMAMLVLHFEKLDERLSRIERYLGVK